MSGGNQGIEPGTLFLVATPIGNLKDITLKALDVLRSVEVIAAEDTRTTRKLLTHYQIKGPRLVAYHEHNERRRAEELIAMLKEGKHVALVSEAGTPGISDPGAYLVLRAHEEGLPVRPVPGPAAVVASLSCSGFDLKDGFVFVGFLPARANERRKRLLELRSEKRSLVLYEAPHRLLKTLADCLNILGDREAFLARQMTKVHEEYRRTTLGELLQRFQEEPPRGEFTLVVAGAAARKGPEEVTEAEIITLLERFLEEGISTREAVRRVTEELGLAKTRVYQLALKLQRRASAASE